MDIATKEKLKNIPRSKCSKCKEKRTYHNPLAKCYECGKKFCFDHIWALQYKKGQENQEVKDICEACKIKGGYITLA
jgi:hypothetical protein